MVRLIYILYYLFIFYISVGFGNIGIGRSYAVKEVEHLKQNREKQRIRQDEIKEEKVALMNQDPGNPNWETAQMIREYHAGIVSSKLAWPFILPTVKRKRVKHIPWAVSLMAK